jgi:hypothetical protein
MDTRQHRDFTGPAVPAPSTDPAYDDLAVLLHRAETEPIGIDVSDYGDEWCEGFLAGQRSILEEIFAGRLMLPGRGGAAQ